MGKDHQETFASTRPSGDGCYYTSTHADGREDDGISVVGLLSEERRMQPLNYPHSLPVPRAHSGLITSCGQKRP